MSTLRDCPTRQLLLRCCFMGLSLQKKTCCAVKAQQVFLQGKESCQSRCQENKDTWQNEEGDEQIGKRIHSVSDCQI